MIDYSARFVKERWIDLATIVFYFAIMQAVNLSEKATKAKESGIIIILCFKQKN